MSRAERDKRRRDRMRAAGICVNGWSHGKVHRGDLCLRCWSRKSQADQAAWRDGSHRLHRQRSDEQLDARARELDARGDA